jgi:hypothetical protein
MVVADVYRAEVPVFVDKEVHYIDCMENGGNDDGVGDEAVELVLVGHEGEITGAKSVEVKGEFGLGPCDGPVKHWREGSY